VVYVVRNGGREDERWKKENDGGMRETKKKFK
jgi:hypothetical protein